MNLQEAHASDLCFFLMLILVKFQFDILWLSQTAEKSSEECA